MLSWRVETLSCRQDDCGVYPRTSPNVTGDGKKFRGNLDGFTVARGRADRHRGQPRTVGTLRAQLPHTSRVTFGDVRGYACRYRAKA